MDRPVHQIGGIIGALCQGTKDEQKRALDEYFTPDAYFIHPFCRVPSFTFKLPFVDEQITSRWLITFVYQWYRILSPHIDIKIDSTVFDQRSQLLYLSMHQVFTLWFIPFSLWQAHVRLVTVLKLESLPMDKHGHALINGSPAAPGEPIPTRYFVAGQEDHYQVDEWLKFIAPWGASLLWYAWQIFATFLCTIGVAIFWPVTTIYDQLLQKWGKPAKKH
ncbi:hypothetical protein BJ170DRAFT_680413 [Xylariales sp. AK1849]|nr:hypothetical protein BJ170DRAFT_680413 [Xylariales sp. AK1849]